MQIENNPECQCSRIRREIEEKYPYQNLDDLDWEDYENAALEADERRREVDNKRIDEWCIREKNGEISSIMLDGEGPCCSNCLAGLYCWR